MATVLARAETRPEIIHHIVKAFFESLDDLRKASPIFSSLRQEDMFEIGLTAPLHEGLLKYLSELDIKPSPHLSTPPKSQPDNPPS